MTERTVKNHQRGQWAEQVAFEYLKRKKLKLLSRNYHSPAGEIDLIMLHHETIVFIEVRFRSDNSYLHALETINEKKCTRIIKTSQHYLQTNRWAANNPCRFDVITVSEKNDNPEIGWIKNAFQA